MSVKTIDKEFWLGHIFTLVATVLGVYLAANSGFEKAVEFDLMQRERDSYYIQIALLNELKGNADAIDSWLDEFDRDENRDDMHLRKEKYRLNQFFWDTIPESSAVFEVPYPRIGQVSEFYDTAQYQLDILLSGNPFEAPKAALKLRALTKQLRTDFLSRFEQQLSDLRREIERGGVSI
ncbi:hypothetical protein FKG94_21920 [Exilibacterium tricleocarpae]|uniref:Uncharacterized protein n=1 Tax=Exilibacterium tricleocarpae TaxID=2591008 RepID=A0A545SZ12_9GAMM|nr:hypothetical protein [Exilibacterium tricleocarpae]TQV70181.1 hypothetical protein FKG94_21920 [Exilibacterium tricleocarpae]